MAIRTQPLNGLALCAGVGGLELGIKLAVPGYRTVCYVEREAHAASVLVARMEDKALDQAPVWDDLESFDGRAWRGVVDLITAGIPCQPYSVAGKQEGHADDRALWPEFVRIVGECRPSLVFIENVPAFARWFREPGERLCELGYEIEEPLFLAAEDLGAPHKRERVFILAHAASAGTGWTSGMGGGGEGWARPDERSDAVADTSGSGGFQVPPPGPPDRTRRDVAASAGGELADAPGLRRDGHSTIAGGAGEGERVGWVCESRRARQGVAEPPSRGAPTDEQRRRLCGPLAGLPVFPPGPSDLHLWARVLAEAPTLEPALCKLAHESPYWVEQLRALGNAVVPLVAAVAFLALTARIRGVKQ